MTCFHTSMSSAHVTEDLHRIDLNLLVALDALTRERSVTKAAKRAGVTQSAMSHTLRRLRDLFDDPLLVRGRGGMVLTPRAEALAIPLRSGLVSLARGPRAGRRIAHGGDGACGSSRTESHPRARRPS